MSENVLSFAITFALLLVSVFCLCLELLPFRLQKRGLDAVATVESVDYMIARGLRHYFGADSKKQGADRAVRCDYILSLRYQPAGQAERTVQVTVPAHLRISEGKRLPYFQAGDRVSIRYAKAFLRLPVVMQDGVALKQSKPLMLLLWGGSALLLAAILVTSVIQILS